MEERNERNHRKVRNLVMTALFAALGYVATAVLMVPSPTGGYLNLGDTVVLLGAYLLGPVYGAVAGGIGPAMADLLGGYTMYVPGTLAIKALMGVLAASLYRKIGRVGVVGVLICGVAAEAVMVLGYWIYDGVLVGSLLGSAVGIPSNLVQAAFGVIASTVLLMALRKSSYVCRQFPKL